MKNFEKPSKNKSEYKNTSEWLDAVYEKNRALIDEKLGTQYASPKEQFKAQVKEYMIQDNMSPTKALKTLARSRVFTEDYEAFREYAWEGLKEKPMAYKRFRELTKEKGRYSAFDPTKLRWDKRSKVYIYNDEIVISFQNSPEDVIVYRIPKVGP
jgi:hypothetical protein